MRLILLWTNSKRELAERSLPLENVRDALRELFTLLTQDGVVGKRRVLLQVRNRRNQWLRSFLLLRVSLFAF
jgi:hypothetical protein